MEEGNDIIICDEFEYPIDIRLVCYTFEYSTDLLESGCAGLLPDEKVNDEKATMQKAPLKADLIIKLEDLLDNFNNLEAINFKNLEAIRDLQAKVEALEKKT